MSHNYEQVTYRDTWAEDEDGNSFVFTVEMKRRLALAGLPIEPEYVKQLPERAPQSRPPRSERPERPERHQEPQETYEIQIDPQTGKYIGRLKWYNPAKGYGFIARGGGEPDIFFHKTSALGEPEAWEEGRQVLYDVEERQKGPEAAEVEPYDSVE
jgi:CspA family cold shock protein